ncbi:MAG: hypothetical protein V9F03_12670 [Microthrixaceae bacterium]
MPGASTFNRCVDRVSVIVSSCGPVVRLNVLVQVIGEGHVASDTETLYAQRSRVLGDIMNQVVDEAAPSASVSVGIGRPGSGFGRTGASLGGQVARRE